MQSRKNTSIFNVVTTHYVAVILSIACLLTTGCAGYIERHQAERQKEGMRILNQVLEKQHAKAQAEHMAQR